MSTLNLENIKHPDSASNNISVDSSGRVGIGTGSPDKPLHIYGNTSNNHQIRLQNDFGSGADWTLNAYGANGNLYIGNNLDRLVVDSAGRVTMPYQPAFNVGRSGTQAVGGTDVILFNSTANTGKHNIGGHYNSSTGRFTAPVSGVYAFNFFILVEGASNGQFTEYTMRHSDGSDLCFSMRQLYQNNYTGNGGYMGDQNSVSLYLNANDYVFVRNSSGVSKTIHSNPTFTYFSGYLIG